MRQKTIEINGVEYALQAIPFRSYMEINDRHTDKHGKLLRTPYMAELFKHCVVKPHVTLEDFDDDYESGIELGVEIENFLTSRDTEKADRKDSKE